MRIVEIMYEVSKNIRNEIYFSENIPKINNSNLELRYCMHIKLYENHGNNLGRGIIGRKSDKPNPN